MRHLIQIDDIIVPKQTITNAYIIVGEGTVLKDLTLIHCTIRSMVSSEHARSIAQQNKCYSCIFSHLTRELAPDTPIQSLPNNSISVP